MDWKSVNFDWNRARAFLVAAEEGSLSAAAKALGMAQSTLGRQVAALEDELSVTLFERVGKGLELTESGLELLHHVKAMGEAAGQFSLKASGHSTSLEGKVCITVTPTIAVYFLGPILKKLKLAEPGITIELVSTNDTSDLKRREADIAIRNFRPPQPDLIAKRLPDTHAYLYIQKKYLEEFGPIQSASDLKKFNFIGFQENSRYIMGLQELGIDTTGFNFVFTSNDHLAHWEMVKSGLGVGINLEKLCSKDTSVTRVPFCPKPFVAENWLVTHKELKTNLKIRKVFDFLATELSSAFT